MTDREFCEYIVKNGKYTCIKTYRCDFNGSRCNSCILSCNLLGENGCGSIGDLAAAEYWLSQNPAENPELLRQKGGEMITEYYRSPKLEFVVRLSFEVENDTIIFDNASLIMADKEHVAIRFRFQEADKEVFYAARSWEEISKEDFEEVLKDSSFHIRFKFGEDEKR